ncbi:MAG: AAA family ATPase [Gammaproteobacteria bacterium]|nr:AAA family ATPase [Gammaproteobacteria bacterium]
MSNQKDLAAILRSRVPLVAVNTSDETHFLETLTQLNVSRPEALPMFMWTITDGLRRADIDFFGKPVKADPAGVLNIIRQTEQAGQYILLDFHPYLEDPKIVRALKDIATNKQRAHHVMLVSHALEVPPELESYTAIFDLKPPDRDQRKKIIAAIAREWQSENSGMNVRADRRAIEMLVDNIGGLNSKEAERLARNAIFDDGVICQNDVATVMEKKYQLLNQQGLLAYEYETISTNDIGGMARFKDWLSKRAPVFQQSATNGEDKAALDPPRGVLLIGVQGCGKSTAAKLAASVFGVPLLRLDFSALYNKYYGESERNLRESLSAAELMSPCVVWIDELEKGLSVGQDESGTSHRVLGHFLTWLSEKNNKAGRRTFVVATANNIMALPPELVRKGRFDEIFFVDLPNAKVRRVIFEIHLARRGHQIENFDLPKLVKASEGFSGAEIEQAIVAAMYTRYGSEQPLNTDDVVKEITQTRPLSVVMDQQVQALRDWASARTVSVD